MHTPHTAPEKWTQVLDEQFLSLDAWTKYNNWMYLDTIALAEQVALVEGGGLRITAIDDLIDSRYPSGQIRSNSTYQFGYFECRCKIPAGAGLWPAFFLYGVDDDSPVPEIDIFESFADGYITATIWLDGVQHISRHYYGDLSDDYHIFAVRWSADRICIIFDGELLFVSVGYVPQTPLNMMTDLYVGGWAGPPTGTTFPVIFDVDYIKVWQQ